MQKVSVTDKKQRLDVLLRKKQARIQSLLLKPELTKKEQSFIAEEGELVNLVPEIIRAVEGEDARVLPNVVDLEEAVLGAIILEANVLPVLLPFLEAGHFYAPVHVEIYQAILGLAKRSEPVDMRTVVLQLRRNGKLEFVGGAAGIAELTSKVSSAANCEYHARIVVEFAMKRALISLGGALINDGYDDTVDVFDLLEALDKEIIKIKSSITNPNGRKEDRLQLQQAAAQLPAEA